MDIGQYNIQVLRGLSSTRSLLSCLNNGALNLSITDDSSGRQRWDIQMIDTGVFTFKVSGGTNPGKEFLRWDRASLGAFDVNFAAWAVRAVTTTPQIPAYYSIAPFEGGTDFTKRLSCSPDGRIVDIAPADDGSGRQRWQFQGPAIEPHFLWSFS